MKLNEIKLGSAFLALLAADIFPRHAKLLLMVQRKNCRKLLK